MSRLRDFIGFVTFKAGQEKIGKDLRGMALKTAKTLRGPTEKARQSLEELGEVAQFVEAEAASWAEPEAITEAAPFGDKVIAFDACDLRHWLALAERAGVAYVPAQQICSLHEDELSAIDQKLRVPGFIGRAIDKGLKRALPELEGYQPPDKPEINPEEVSDRIFNAMDEIPRDWMVRANICGSSMLKSFAGSGLIGDGRDGAKIAEEVEVGAGWVQVGNRRRIDATDNRFAEMFARGHKDTIHYLARPWMTPARKIVGDDPHRHGSPFAGKGEWPCEWRVFIENGRVTGVASYYGWIGESTPENAAKALEAVEKATIMMDVASSINLAPRLMDIELTRRIVDQVTPENAPPDIDRARDIMQRFSRNSIAATLDFIETDQGMMLLEGGPGHTPLGGGHPCAFAGYGVEGEASPFAKVEGVALRIMDHICLGDPITWVDGDHTDRILTWDEARALAAQYTPEAPEDEGMEP
jgi:hypothetical protein